LANFIKGFMRKRKYGEEIVVVSGLPRSGTSMMMKMLEAAGLPIMTDAVRKADEDNPKGYYEYERVKDLEKDPDKSWVRNSRGKVLKVISFLLKELPPDNFYRVIFLQRDLDEVIASQKKMLDRRGEETRTEDERMKDIYRNHLIQVKILIPGKPNFELLEVKYKEVLDNPRHQAQRINEFLGGGLDTQAMVSAVDKQLYRNRKEEIASSSP
jgi:hypothetical protein